MRTKILLAVVLTLTLILSSCANQPTSEQLVEEQLALILTQSALNAVPSQELVMPATATPTMPAPATGAPGGAVATPDASIKITAIQQIGPNTAIINWDGIGNFPSGFNVVWTNEVRRPISPRDDGSFTNDPFARTSLFSGEPGYVYILRVCRFTGEGCDVYSDTAFFTFRRYAPTPTPNRTATARALTQVAGGGGGGGGGGGTSATAAPKFAIISIKDAGNLKARMLWTSDSNPARGFRIYYSTSNKEPGYGKDSYFAISDGKVREAYVDGKAGTTYYYRICKFTGSGCDAYTPAVSHTYPGTAAKPTSTQVAATEDTTTILIATIRDEDPGTATITWAASGDFPDGFKVMYSRTNPNPTLGDTVVTVSDGTSRSAVVEGQPSAAYYFRVCKYSGTACTLYSPAATFTFAAMAEDPSFVLFADAAITDPGRVLLEWDQLDPAPDSLVVMWTYPDTPVYPTHAHAEIAGTSSSYDISGLGEGVDYNFRLCKSNGSYCTEYSTVLHVTAPAAPPAP